MQRTIALASKGMTALAGGGIVIMLLLVTADVLARSLFNIAIPGTDTIVASYLMVATIFLPLALLEILDENIAVDVLRDNVPDRIKDIFDIIAHLLAAGYYALLGWLYWHVALEAFAVKEFVTGSWDVPIWPARVFMPLGLFVATLASVSQLFTAIKALVTGSKPSEHHPAGGY